MFSPKSRLILAPQSSSKHAIICFPLLSCFLLSLSLSPFYISRAPYTLHIYHKSSHTAFRASCTLHSLPMSSFPYPTFLRFVRLGPLSFQSDPSHPTQRDCEFEFMDGDEFEKRLKPGAYYLSDKRNRNGTLMDHGRRFPTANTNLASRSLQSWV